MQAAGHFGGLPDCVIVVVTKAAAFRKSIRVAGPGFGYRLPATGFFLPASRIPFVPPLIFA
jgi:hypothetical protein